MYCCKNNQKLHSNCMMWCGRDVDSPERVCSAEVSYTGAASELHGERQPSCTEAGDAVGHRGTARLQHKYCTAATRGLPGIQHLHRLRRRGSRKDGRTPVGAHSLVPLPTPRRDMHPIPRERIRRHPTLLLRPPVHRRCAWEPRRPRCGDSTARPRWGRRGHDLCR